MKSVIIQNETGLHARPCSLIASLASSCPVDAYLVKDGKPYNAKSIMGLMSMGVTKGTELLIDCEDEALSDALYKLLSELND